MVKKTTFLEVAPHGPGAKQPNSSGFVGRIAPRIQGGAGGHPTVCRGAFFLSIYRKMWRILTMLRGGHQSETALED